MLRIAMLSFAHVHADGYARQIVGHPEAEIGGTDQSVAHSSVCLYTLDKL